MRRRCRRRINYKFNEIYFKPRGVPLRSLPEVVVTFEELEVLRLRYIEKFSQLKAAQKLEISQSQYQRDYVSVLKKITKALIDGQAIRIEKKE